MRQTTKPVLFIPGFPGSNLHELNDSGGPGRKVFLNTIGLLWPRSRRRILARLALDEDADPRGLEPGQPVRKLASFLFFDLAKQAESLYELLDRLDVQTAKLGWDWRLGIDDPGTRAHLQVALDELFEQAQRPVTIIAHSTGGLVLRHFLESSDAATLAKIKRVIAFGVPWVGTLKALELLSAQQSVGPISKDESRDLMATTIAAYDLLPPDPSQTPMRDENDRPLRLVVDTKGTQLGPLIPEARSWLADDQQLRQLMTKRADASLARLGQRSQALQLATPVEIVNIVGWGAETAVEAKIEASGSVAFSRSKGDSKLEGGDGTVPRRSAAWLRGPEVRTYHVPVGIDPRGRSSHSVLWRTPGGRSLLRRHLAKGPVEPFVWAAVDDEDYVSGAQIRVRMVALDADGRPLLGARARVIGGLGPDSSWSSFDSSLNGRHLLILSRAKLRPVSAALRRLTLELAWKGVAGLETKTIGFFVHS